MKRLLTIILTGAAIVAAQPAQDSTAQAKKYAGGKDMAQIMTQLRSHLDSALGSAEIDVAKARKAAEEFQKQMKGKSAEEIKVAMEERRKEANVQLQNAITKLENASADVKAQVEEVSAKIQARLQEKTEELKAIQARIEAHRAEIDAHVAEMKGKNPETTPETKN